jgi:polyhydroxybutyrate depolymerase
MKRFVHRLAWLALAVFSSGLGRGAAVLEPRTLIGAGMARDMLVYQPAGARPAPLVLVCLRENTNPTEAARSWAVHEAWPEAIVVYLHGRVTTGGGSLQPKWENTASHYDLGIFDVILEQFASRTDPTRVFVIGDSSGGDIAFLVWAERGDKLAGVAPCAAIVSALLPRLKPRPAFFVAGENDPELKFLWQRNVIAAVMRQNQCAPVTPLPPGRSVHASKLGAPVVTLIHPGGHELPADAPREIVAFFRGLGK